MKRKRSLKFKFGIALIALTALMLAAIPLWTHHWGNIDFPCEWFGTPPSLANVNLNTRIAYCISVYPRSAYGAAPLVYGSTEKDKLTIGVYGSLSLQRQGDSLVVNNRRLQVGETNDQHLSSPTLNPWLLSTTDFSVKNEGVLKTVSGKKENMAPDILYVSGNAKEGRSEERRVGKECRL